MIFISSFRPHQNNADYALNQSRAVASWGDVADNIFLFGDHEPDLAGEKVVFVKASGRWPAIRELLQYAAICDDVTCLINADIVVGPTFELAVDAWLSNRGVTATSKRHEYDPNNYPNSLRMAKVVDQGFDFFMARQQAWKLAVEKCPPKMFIGHCVWDNWMLGLFAVEFGKWNFDLTRFKFLFHPKHGNRQQPLSVEVEGQAYIEHHGHGRRL